MLFTSVIDSLFHGKGNDGMFTKKSSEWFNVGLYRESKRLACRSLGPPQLNASGAPSSRKEPRLGSETLNVPES